MRSAMMTWAEQVSSLIEITDSSEALFTKVMISLVSGGVMRPE